MSSLNKKKHKFADYVLYWKASVPVAIVEAKEYNKTVSSVVQQGLLQAPSTFSSSSDAFAPRSF
jgi:type I restriction enzyme R subunit